VQYRKRKVFFGETGKIESLVPTMIKHKGEKYLVPLSSVHNDSIATMLDAKKLQHTECVMYRTVSNDFTEEEKAAFDYDMLIFSSPTGMKALKKNFPDFEQGDIRIGAFGPATAKEVVAEGFRLDLEAPSKEYPSMTSALQAYLKKNK
jgi:uroporphyrinogen-III synthase